MAIPSFTAACTALDAQHLLLQRPIHLAFLAAGAGYQARERSRAIRRVWQPDREELVTDKQLRVKFQLNIHTTLREFACADAVVRPCYEAHSGGGGGRVRRLQKLDVRWETVGKLKCMRMPVKARGWWMMDLNVEGDSEDGSFDRTGGGGAWCDGLD